MRRSFVAVILVYFSPEVRVVWLSVYFTFHLGFHVILRPFKTDIDNNQQTLFYSCTIVIACFNLISLANYQQQFVVLSYVVLFIPVVWFLVTAKFPGLCSSEDVDIEGPNQRSWETEKEDKEKEKEKESTDDLRDNKAEEKPNREVRGPYNSHRTPNPPGLHSQAASTQKLKATPTSALSVVAAQLQFQSSGRQQTTTVPNTKPLKYDDYCYYDSEPYVSDTEFQSQELEGIEVQFQERSLLSPSFKDILDFPGHLVSRLGLELESDHDTA